MRNCPYIEFESLKLSGNGSKYGPISATVWRREKLSASLGMTEDQLVEWTILIGNDYTKSLYTTTMSPYTIGGLKASAHTMKPNLSSDSKGPSPLTTEQKKEQMWKLSDYPRLEMLRNFVISKGIDFRVTSNRQDVNEYLEYSRSLYNLENVQKYDEDEQGDKRKRDHVHDTELDPSYHLNADQKNEFTNWMATHAPKTVQSSSVGTLVVQFLRTYFKNLVEKETTDSAKKNSAESKNISNNGVPVNLFPDISLFQLNAFSVMLTQIAVKIRSLRDQTMEKLYSSLTSNLIMSGIAFEDGDDAESGISKHVRDLSKKIQGKRREKSHANTHSEHDTTLNTKYLEVHWSNVRAARTFQLLCKLLTSKGQRSASATNVSIKLNNPILSPATFFESSFPKFFSVMYFFD